MMKTENTREESKAEIRELYTLLMQRSEKDSHLLNITDVLSQVYQKMDTAKNPEMWLSRLVNYIYTEGFSRIHLTKDEEILLIELGNTAKKAGWNGRYGSDAVDKSQFYSVFESIPRR